MALVTALPLGCLSLNGWIGISARSIGPVHHAASVDARGTAWRPVSPAGVPAGLQAVISKVVAGQRAASPSGVTWSRGRNGAVTFRASGLQPGAFVLTPLSIGRSSANAFSSGSFVVGRPDVSGNSGVVSQGLGSGVTAWYKAVASGVEQGFTVARRPAGTGGHFAIVMGYRGTLSARAEGPTAIVLSGPGGPVMTYGALRVTDARGHRVPARFAVTRGLVRIVVADAHAAYPLTVDPFVAPSPTPTATFEGQDSYFDDFGLSVALSADGQTALVGAPQGGQNNQGAAYMFTESGGTWQAAPVATFEPQGSLFGYSVALSADGQTVLVGAPQDYGGAAYLYRESGGSWPANPTATFTGVGGGLGSSVALSANGQTALVGAHFRGQNPDGAAYLYAESAGTWPATPTATFTATPGSGEFLGQSVALSGDGQTALIGAPDYNSSAGTYDGAAYLYAESAGTWPATPTATFTAIPGSDDFLGQSVALSGDGQTALIGAPGAGTTSTGLADGAAFVYTESAGTWPGTPTATFTAAPGSDQQLGSSVAMSGDGHVALVGAVGYGQPSGSFQPGAAYVYPESGGGWPDTPAVTFTEPAGQLGISAALSADGEVALVGAVEANGYYGAAAVYGTPVTTTATTTAVSSSANPSPAGHQVTYTATVSPAPGAGTVSFTDNGSPISGCGAQPVNTSTGTAACATTPGTAGAHNIVAAYTGSAGFAASTSAVLTQVVTSAPCPSLAGCNLHGLNLAGAQLARANLTGANLTGANLTGANLTGANLTGANLTGTNLNDADLDDANLTGANLNGANLTGAQLAGANLTGANLNKADLTGADLSGADVTGANFNKVTWSNTTCPDGTNSDADSGTCTGHL
jgi:uncharacterized protein YjbI with pentapeptide repeats